MGYWGCSVDLVLFWWTAGEAKVCWAEQKREKRQQKKEPTADKGAQHQGFPGCVVESGRAETGDPRTGQKVKRRREALGAACQEGVGGGWQLSGGRGGGGAEAGRKGGGGGEAPQKQKSEKRHNKEGATQFKSGLVWNKGERKAWGEGIG